jgi:polyhydroxybutyrate depolymerase
MRPLLSAFRALLVVLLVAACASAGATPNPTSDPTPSPIPRPTVSPILSPTPEPSPTASPTVDAPTAPPDGIVVGGDRPVIVHLPPDHDPAVPAPLLVVLHGYTASGALADEFFGLRQLAADNAMLYAYPDGSRDSQGVRFWNASTACCDFERSGADDAGYLAGLLEEIGEQVAVDRSRVYFAGHSNGGFMSYRMACDHADLVAAIVSLAGATPTTAECRPSEPVAVLQVHGSADRVVPFEGRGTLGAGLLGARRTVEAWADYNGCELEPTELPARLDVDRRLDGRDGEPADTTIEVYADGCRRGGHAELWTIEEGGHVPRLTDEFAEAVIDFLLAHPKPGR